MQMEAVVVEVQHREVVEGEGGGRLVEVGVKVMCRDEVRQLQRGWRFLVRDRFLPPMRLGSTINDD